MKKTPNNMLGRPTVEEFSRMEKMPVAVVLDNIRSLNNVGSFFRTCDAFGAQRILLCGITAAPPNREIHKTALGAEDSVRWQYFATTIEALASLIDEGYTLMAVEQTEGSLPLARFEPEAGMKYALVFGNEVDGVSQQAVDMCGRALEIPQVGTKHSLNVAVSGGVVLWHFFCRLTGA